jgi:hypothetical protein
MKNKNKKLWINCVFAFLASFVFVACKAADIKTIIPPRIVEEQPSWDENTQNSGIIEYVEGKGFLITNKALTRYESLVALLGTKEIPPILSGEGVTIEPSGKIYLTSEAAVHFVVLSDKFKAGVR